nr:hypothetical protein FVER53263_21161 [Fusarium verticillioides]
MSWKRSSLADTGFFYDEDLTNEDRDRLPAHVKSLEQAMLDFTCQKLDSPTTRDLNIQCEAERLIKGGFSEDSWVEFYRKFLFNSLLKYASVSRGGSRISSRCQYYYDYMVSTNDLWGAFTKNDEKNEVLKAPKPDLVFYLPMYHPDAHIPAITDHEALQWHKASASSLVEPFSWSTLKKLHGCGLLATPFNVFSDKESEEPQEPQERYLSCFPWLIVEYKKAESKPAELKQLQEVVYCQAANASGCAIKLLETASKHALRLDDEAQVPPVASVTTVGSRVKVWITFFARDFMAYRIKDMIRGKKKEQLYAYEEGYRMQCIWTGDMRDPEDILKFRIILENTYTWAKRAFKPLIATYIDQWKFAYAMDVPGIANTEKQRRQERLGLSRCALRLALSSLDAHPNLESQDDLFGSVTNSVIDLCDRFVQDVERVIEEELKHSSGGKQRARTPSKHSRKQR